MKLQVLKKSQLAFNGPIKVQATASYFSMYQTLYFIFSTHPLPNPLFTSVINPAHLTHQYCIWTKL